MTGIDGGEGRDAAGLLEEVRALEREGELFRAYDVAMHGLEQHPGDWQLQHRAVLCLASAGASSQAMSQFAAFRLDRLAGIEVDALRARLMKDDALAATGTARREKLLAAAACYRQAFAAATARNDREAYYPAINAATLHLLAGEGDTAKVLARQVMDALGPTAAAERPYYEIATAIEANLILGDVPAARDLVPAALAAQGATPDFRATSTTVRQCRMVIEALGQEGGWLSQLAPPRVIHYTGHLIAAPGNGGRFLADEEDEVRAQIEDNLDKVPVGSAYGSLAAGADILFAEALLRRKVSLNIVLPFRKDEFIETSVRPSGNDWVARFERCLAGAASVRYATEDAYLGDDRLYGYCSQLAMGLTLLRARHLSAPAEQLAVWDGQPRVGDAGTATDTERWQKQSGSATTIIRCRGTPGHGNGGAATRASGGRSTRAMLFGDVKGFSKLTDAQLPSFIENVVGLFADVLEQNSRSFDFVNTWGDGLFIVSADAGKAARIALALQDRMNGFDMTAVGLPATMALRIGGHLGPVYPGHDRVLKRENFFGAHVSRAARIEPVTPPGCVYVTETFAAVLELYHAAEFSCDYVGMTAAAKGYGQMRMFLLRRKVRS